MEAPIPGMNVLLVGGRGRKRWRAGVLGLMAVAGVGSALAHPTLSQEVSYPVVLGFERFYAAGDPEAYLAEGGKLLLNELNCVACHQVPSEWSSWFPGRAGPSLEGVASRVRSSFVLQLQVRNPRFLKRGTTMPSLFSAGDRDPQELDALFHYLASKRLSEGEPMLLGEVEAGKELYHEVGCVACHAPDLEYFPARWPPDQGWDFPGMNSIPLRWAGVWEAPFLTRYLLEPE
ncbi:MAG: hypothetical protein AAF191_17385, partial [Verrucomicrobiota bacterium]